MNILLTGGAGYIGSHTAIVLLLAGHQVVIYDNLSNSRVSVLKRLSQITGQRIPFVRGDVRNTGLLTSTLAANRIDAVIHFAGQKAVGESVKQPMNYYANNVQGTISLLQAMRSNGLRTLVFSSSATVYGVPQYLPYDEPHPTNAVNPYGRTKLHIEQMLADLADSDEQWRIAALRYFNPVGAHESGLIGDAPGGVPNNLMPYVGQVAAGHQPFLKVFGNDYPTVDGTGVRDYVHVMDLAEGHLAAVTNTQAEAGWHAYNLGTGRGTSVLEVVRAFEVASGRSVPLQFVGRRSGDLPEYYASVYKAESRLGWRASRTLLEMCSSSWAWQQRCERLLSHEY
jgi:UDP-glucose 4-epimerase